MVSEKFIGHGRIRVFLDHTSRTLTKVVHGPKCDSYWLIVKTEVCFLRNFKDGRINGFILEGKFLCLEP